ncbi:MAG TPA: protein-disulfide reductase DsbD domain-containing protein [Casimicrobiaceae bacterium]|nr:protein-disulfide reductase DsbD domain-containing protein [Casimicrobiaceae bacterium]
MDLPLTLIGSALKRIVNAVAVALVLATLTVSACATGLDLPGAEAKLLPPEQAFRFSARVLDSKTVEGRYDVVDGYYLYRDKLRFMLQPAPPALGSAELPAGQRKHDEFFGDVEIYRGAVTVKLPIVGGTAGQSLVLVADSQGCADVGVCYPPTRQQIRLTVPAAGGDSGPFVGASPPRKGLFD